MFRWHSDLARCFLRIEEGISSVEDAPSNVKLFAICLEDRRFYNHPGFDWVSIVRATLLNAVGFNAGGASTIEQQLVRTITGERQRSFVRKLKEIFLARAISKRYGKDTLINIYLSIAYFGYGLSGCDAASLQVFEKETNDLDAASAAVIASLLLYPVPRTTTFDWVERVMRRARYAFRIAEDIGRASGIGEWAIGYKSGSFTLASDKLRGHAANLTQPFPDGLFPNLK